MKHCRFANMQQFWFSKCLLSVSLGKAISLDAVPWAPQELLLTAALVDRDAKTLVIVLAIHECMNLGGRVSEGA